MTPTTRLRRAAPVVAAAAGLSLIAACSGGDTGGGGASENDGVTTLVWQAWAGSDNETEALNDLVAMVEEQHDDIRIDLQTTPFLDYWTRLTAQASGGDVGCILGVQGQRAPLIEQLMMPLEPDALQAAGIDTGDFNAEMLQALQADGTQIAIPYDLGPQVVFYNVDAFDAAGVAVPENEWTVEDFTAAAEELTGDGMDGYALFPTYDVFSAWSSTLTGQQGITDDGDLQLDTPELIEAFSTLQGFREAGVSSQVPATTDTATALNTFMSGGAAMVVDGPWQYGNIVDNAAFTAGVAPMPAGPDGSQSVLAGSGYGISAGCSAPEQALEALAVITGPEALQHLGEIGRAYPARTAQADAWYQGELAEAKPALDFAIDRSTYLRTNGQMNQMNQLFQQYAIPAFNGQGTAADFLAQVQQGSGGA